MPLPTMPARSTRKNGDEVPSGTPELNGIPTKRSSRNTRSSTPATPSEPRHNHFSIGKPLSANMA